MNLDSKLKLQAYLDDELSSAEARQVGLWLDQDAEAQALYQELKSTRACLVENEMTFKTPETPEFYWSKIQRAILEEEKSQERATRKAGPFWWLKWVAPVAAVALVMLILQPALDKRAALTPSDLESGNLEAIAQPQEIETVAVEAAVVSFRSESEGLSVVWIDSNAE